MIIKKFGGTSLGKKGGLDRIVKIVQSSNEPLCVVVSAFSAHNKKEGTTNRLMEATELAGRGKTSFNKILKEILKNHLSYLKGWNNHKIAESCAQFIQSKIDNLEAFLRAISIIGETTYKSEDNILCVGEQLSAKIFAAKLEDYSIPAKAIDLSNLIRPTNKEKNKQFFTAIEKKLQKYRKESNQKILVFTGFLGNFYGGIIKSLGRGYTDFTAALLTSALKAKQLEIWKEVDGVFNADPNLVPNAKLISSIHPEEASELTYYGSEVVHPSVVNYIEKKKIPICIKNTFAPEKQGTTIISEAKEIKERTMAATCKKNILLINIHSNKMLMAYGFMAEIFDIFSKYKIIIDIIATSEVNVSLTLAKQNLPKAMIKELKAIGNVTIQDKMSIVSLVGRGLRKKIGVAGKMFSTLAKGDINIEVISQGASEINISCVVCSKNADKSIYLLHKEILN